MAADVELNPLLPAGGGKPSGSESECRPTPPDIDGAGAADETQPFAVSSEMINSDMVASSSKLPESMMDWTRRPSGVCCAMCRRRISEDARLLI